MYNRNWVWPTNQRARTFYLLSSALLIASSVVLTRYFSILPFEGVRISMGPVPISLAGFLLGPVFGGITGLLSDLLGQILRPQGAPHYGIMLNQILYGVLPGLIVYLMKRLNLKVVCFSTLLSTVLLSMLLQTRWQMDFVKQSFAVVFVKRLPSIGVNAFILIAACLFLYPAMLKMQEIVWSQNRHSRKL